MNIPLPPHFHQSAVTNNLRDLACSWLQSLRDTVSAFATIEVPYPNYPLPQGFPFRGTAFRERFRWVDIREDNLSQINESYYVRLELHAPHDLSSSVAWSLTSGEELNLLLLVLDVISNFRGGCRLGYVYFDRRIYEEDIPTASHSPKGEWRHMRFTIDTVSQDREGSTHLSLFDTCRIHVTYATTM